MFFCMSDTSRSTVNFDTCLCVPVQPGFIRKCVLWERDYFMAYSEAQPSTKAVLTASQSPVPAA